MFCHRICFAFFDRLNTSCNKFMCQNHILVFFLPRVTLRLPVATDIVPLRGTLSLLVYWVFLKSPNPQNDRILQSHKTAGEAPNPEPWTLNPKRKTLKPSISQHFLKNISNYQKYFYFCREKLPVSKAEHNWTKMHDFSTLQSNHVTDVAKL